MKNDLYHQALNAYHEARGESDAGIKAVVKVVLNRARERDMSPHDVIYQKYQFEWTIKGKPNPLFHDPKGYKRIRLLVKQAIIEYDNGDTIQGADHYHADYMNPFPNWVSGMEQRVAHIGQHIFYRS